MPHHPLLPPSPSGREAGGEGEQGITRSCLTPLPPGEGPGVRARERGLHHQGTKVQRVRWWMAVRGHVSSRNNPRRQREGWLTARSCSPLPAGLRADGTYDRYGVPWLGDALDALTPCPPLHRRWRGGTQPQACAVPMRQNEAGAHVFCPSLNPAEAGSGMMARGRGAGVRARGRGLRHRVAPQRHEGTKVSLVDGIARACQCPPRSAAPAGGMAHRHILAREAGNVTSRGAQGHQKPQSGELHRW